MGALYTAVVAAIALIPSWNHAGALLATSGLLVVAFIANSVHLSTAANRLRAATHQSFTRRP